MKDVLEVPCFISPRWSLCSRCVYGRYIPWRIGLIHGTRGFWYIYLHSYHKNQRNPWIGKYTWMLWDAMGMVLVVLWSQQSHAISRFNPRGLQCHQKSQVPTTLGWCQKPCKSIGICTGYSARFLNHEPYLRFFALSCSSINPTCNLITVPGGDLKCMSSLWRFLCAWKWEPVWNVWSPRNCEINTG